MSKPFDEQQIQKMQRNFLSTWKLRLGLLKTLPLGVLTGLKVTKLNADSCAVAVRYSWLNRNPFRSTYWAVLGMAAELATGIPVLIHTQGQPFSVATIVTGATAKFHKKATTITTFRCDQIGEIREAVANAQESGEPVEVLCRATGTDDSGALIAEWTFTWSMKRRSK